MPRLSTRRYQRQSVLAIVVHRHGGEMFACDGDSAVPLRRRLLLVTVMMACVKHDDQTWDVP